MIDPKKLSVEMSTHWNLYTTACDKNGRLISFFFNSLPDGPFYKIQVNGKSSEIYTDLDVSVNVFNELIGDK